MFAVNNSAGLPKMAERLKSSEVADEIFGTLGYKNATRFFRNDQEQQEWIKENPPSPPPEIELKQKELEKNMKDNDQRHQREVMRLEMEAQLGFARLALDKQIKLDDLYARLGIEHDKNKTARQKIAFDNVVAMRGHAEQQQQREQQQQQQPRESGESK
jgi:hypothetical protein